MLEIHQRQQRSLGDLRFQKNPLPPDHHPLRKICSLLPPRMNAHADPPTGSSPACGRGKRSAAAPPGIIATCCTRRQRHICDFFCVAKNTARTVMHSSLEHMISKRSVPPRGFEPPTNSLGNCCSIQLSYGGWVELRQISQQAASASTGWVTRDRPPSAPISSRTVIPATVAPNRSHRRHVAAAVPPVASTSSTTSARGDA